MYGFLIKCHRNILHIIRSTKAKDPPAQPNNTTNYTSANLVFSNLVLSMFGFENCLDVRIVQIFHIIRIKVLLNLLDTKKIRPKTRNNNQIKPHK